MQSKRYTSGFRQYLTPEGGIYTSAPTCTVKHPRFTFVPGQQTVNKITPINENEAISKRKTKAVHRAFEKIGESTVEDDGAKNKRKYTRSTLISTVHTKNGNKPVKVFDATSVEEQIGEIIQIAETDDGLEVGVKPIGDVIEQILQLQETTQPIQPITEPDDYKPHYTPKQTKIMEALKEQENLEARLKESLVLIYLLYEDLVKNDINSKARKMAGRFLYSAGYEQLLKQLNFEP